MRERKLVLLLSLSLMIAGMEWGRGRGTYEKMMINKESNTSVCDSRVRNRRKLPLTGTVREDKGMSDFAWLVTVARAVQVT